MVSDLITFTNKGCKITTIFFFFLWVQSYEVPFKRLFVPHFPQSNVQTLFLIFGILWEKLWKEVVSYLNIFTHKGCKISVPEKVFAGKLSLTKQDVFTIVCLFVYLFCLFVCFPYLPSFNSLLLD